MHLRGGVTCPIGGGGAGAGALLIGELDHAEQGELLWTESTWYEPIMYTISSNYYLGKGSKISKLVDWSINFYSTHPLVP